MNSTIITIGDELLIGQVVDTHSAWMGQELSQSGISVIRRIAVGDDKKEIDNRVDPCITNQAHPFLARQPQLIKHRASVHSIC